jgi:hypothetical protein
VYSNDHAKKLQNMFHGSSKNEQVVEGGNGATQRTAGTTDTTQKTCESANNSNSMKVSAANITSGKATIPQKPPRDSSLQKNRPQTSGATSGSVAWRFYHYQNNEKTSGATHGSIGDATEATNYGKTTTSAGSNPFNMIGSSKNHGPSQDKTGIVSLSVERNSLKYTR